MYKILITTWAFANDEEGNGIDNGCSVTTEVVSFDNSWDAKNAVEIITKADKERVAPEYGQTAILLFKG